MRSLPHFRPWALAALSLVAGLPAAAEPVSFNKDIRPILVENCFSCHGADSAGRKADLRLDLRDAAIESGAIAPGDPDSSVALDRIFSEDPDEVMPPPALKKTLSAEQKELLSRWIREGAEYEPHWSFIPPVRPEPPAVENAGWVRNPIDRFILAGLEAAGLAPAPEADRRVLARRVSLDLTGLPPEPEVVEAFVADARPDAYERLVDELLAKPEWGEHRGRYWLDYARYADTHGIHFDNYREMWTYRQWVVNAFNRNMPFDQFTILQLAGDLVQHDAADTPPHEVLDSRIASGFNRCNMTTNEGGIINEEYLALYTRDRTETTAAVWMGLTAGCAVCHNHKFDPLTQQEFYELSAFFNNTTQAAKDGNIHDTQPIVVVPAAGDADRWAAVQRGVAEARQRVEAVRQDARREFAEWIAGLTPARAAVTTVQETPLLSMPLAEGEGSSTAIRIGGKDVGLPLVFAKQSAWIDGPEGRKAVSVDGPIAELQSVGNFEFDQPFTVAFQAKIRDDSPTSTIVSRYTSGTNGRGWLINCEKDRIELSLKHAGSAASLRVTTDRQMPTNQWVRVAVSYDGSGAASGVRIAYDGEPMPTRARPDTLGGRTIRTEEPFRVGGSTDAVGFCDLTIWGRVLSAAEVLRLAIEPQFAEVLQLPGPERAGAAERIFDWWTRESHEPSRAAITAVATLEAEQGAIAKRGTVAHVMKEKEGMAKAHVLDRGEYDKPKQEVQPDTPEVLPAFPAELPRNRLGLARWLLLQDHPLTSRVTVNRFWQEVFGTGLVRSAGDFGITGELPSHPELLDWLAVEFRESGWDVKQLIRAMVTSATYRQSAVATPGKLAKDNANRLLSRGPRFRMDAEMVRDSALVASGLLVRRLGGPSVKPYQPEGVWEAVAMTDSNTQKYVPDTGENLYRRSMYWFWKRSAPPTSMDIFNAPSRETCTVKRERTNTPLQALVTLNDPQFVEAARVLADRALQADGGDAARLDLMARRALARPLAPAELEILRGSLADLTAWYAAHPDEAAKLVAVGEAKPVTADPVRLASWTMLANELLNLDEFLCK
jgi:cytochrome c553